MCWSVAANPSPLGVKLHDAGYNAAGLDYKYVALGSSDLPDVIKMVRDLGIRGLGVSMPHKVHVIDLLDEVSDDVRRIGACNTVVNEHGTLVGHNTDWRGALAALDEAAPSNIESALIVGSGGVARAIAYALASRSIRVSVAGRSQTSGATLVSELGLAAVITLDEQHRDRYDLVVNATPDASLDGPVDTNWSPSSKPSVVFDVVFQSRHTPLTTKMQQLGIAIVPGWRMLLHQATIQFELYTEHQAPLSAMSAVLEDALPAE
jgi:shikimate dehydrogenase